MSAFSSYIQVRQVVRLPSLEDMGQGGGKKREKETEKERWGREERKKGGRDHTHTHQGGVEWAKRKQT